MRFLLHLVLFVCGLAVGSSVHAQQLSIEWQAPANCPGKAELRARIAELLADSGLRVARVRVRGSIEQAQAGWTLRLELALDTQQAVRTLHARDCQSLSAAAVGLVALALEPSQPATTPESPPEPTQSETASAGVTPAVTERLPPVAAPPAPSGPAADGGGSARSPTHPLATPVLSWRLGAFGGVFWAGLAGPQASAGLRVGLMLEDILFDLSAIHHFARSRQLIAATGTAEYETQEIALAGCRLWGSTLRLGPCLLVSALRTSGSTSGFAGAVTEPVLWGTLGVSALAAYPVSDDLELRLDAGSWLPITRRPLFFVVGPDNRETAIGDTTVLGLFARLGIGVRL